MADTFLASILIITLSFGMLFSYVVLQTKILDQDVQDEICQKLATYEGNFTNETINQITSEVEKGELVCIYPSFDHTQKIKFRSNAE